MISQLIAGLTALAVLPVMATPHELSRRAAIDHDKVVALPQTVPDGPIGDVYLAYQPKLHVVNGCVPFPGVDKDGNTKCVNKSLRSAFSRSQYLTALTAVPVSNPQETQMVIAVAAWVKYMVSFSRKTGQLRIYQLTYSLLKSTVRSSSSGDYYALMYSWYFPKDEASPGAGHRHDWEGVIVWLKDSTSTAASNIAAVCPSAHGNWNCSTDGYTLDGTAPLIKYQSTWPLNHALGLTTTVGGTQPLVDWDSLSSKFYKNKHLKHQMSENQLSNLQNLAVVQEALETTDFGSGNVPFKDGNFASGLEDATF